MKISKLSLRKKILLGIGALLILFLGRRVYQSQSYTCGDNICHQNKEFETGICPQDCGAKTIAIPDVVSSGQPTACQIDSIEKIAEGSFPKFSPSNELIAFNRITEKHVYEIYTMKPDGTQVACLTCGKEALPANGHKGQPFWHPNGKYIIFTVQNPDYIDVGKGYSSQVDAGRSHNVWIMTADGERFWQMTDYEENWGVIKPTFSSDGTKVFWNEEFSMEKYPKGKRTDILPHPGSYWNYLNTVFRKGEELGAWRVVYADLTFAGDTPKIENIRKVNPPDNFTLLEASGFTPDDEGFNYSYDDLTATKGVALWGEIYTTDLNGNNLKQLTFSAYNHDENAEYSPSGSKIAWSSSTGDPGEGVDLYLMEADGNNKARLTYFSDSSNSDYLGKDYSCREVAWSPNGRQIVVGFGTDYRPYEKDPSYYFDNLYLLTFQGPCGKL